MSNDVKVSKLRILFNIAVALTPFVCLIYGVYFGYFGFYMRNKFNKTYDDIKYITDKIKEQNPSGKYSGFDTQYAILTDIIPFDMKVQKNQDASQSLIKNRFGGNLFFYEGLNSEAERTLYYGLIKEPRKYKKIYSGVSAYIILLTGLSSYECQTLAMYDWSELLNNYIGFEVSSLENNQIYNGFTKLKTGFIPDAENDALYYASIKDKGYISQTPLGEIRAKNKCNCKTDSCTFALKLR